MWTLSALADEIDADLDVQLDTLDALAIRHLELRGVWGKNVLALTDEELRRIKTRLAERGVEVSSIASPIGKSRIGDDFGPELDRFRRALAIAETLEAPFVRIFSFFMPPGDDPRIHRAAVLERLAHLVRIAAGTGLTLVHENERDIYGDTPDRCHDLLTAIDSPTLRMVWDPANFVQVGVRPQTEGYALLRPFVAYVHVKDAILGTKAVVPAGEGDGELRETLAALRDDGFDGFFALEPHLTSGGPYGGFTGPALFGTATDAFKRLLNDQGIPWR
jgi:sugar phosphate isomerase/epimerase